MPFGTSPTGKQLQQCTQAACWYRKLKVGLLTTNISPSTSLLKSVWIPARDDAHGFPLIPFSRLLPDSPNPHIWRGKGVGEARQLLLSCHAQTESGLLCNESIVLKWPHPSAEDVLVKLVHHLCIELTNFQGLLSRLCPPKIAMQCKGTHLVP